MKGNIQKEASLLRDAVFAANDGVITTFAVVMGATGASLSSKVILILGFANLLADGFSMASGIYLGAKSERDYKKLKKDKDWKYENSKAQAVVTFLSFVVAGLVPLVPFIFKLNNVLMLSIVFVGIALFLIGVIRGYYTDKHWLRSGVEVLLIGGFAAFIAYFVGFLVDTYLI